MRKLLLIGALTLGALATGSLYAQSGEGKPVEDEVVNGDAFRFVDPGPLRIRDQFLLGMGFLAFEPVSARVLERGRWQFDFVLTVSNDFAHAGSVEDALDGRGERAPLTLEFLQSIEPEEAGEGKFLVDGEHYRGTLALRRGLGSNLQLDIMVQAIKFDGGFLDNTVENFHEIFGLNQAGRDTIPQDQFAVYIDSADYLLWADREPEWDIGDAVIGLKADLRPARGPRTLELAIEGKVKIPLGDSDQFSSSENLDFGLQFLSTKYFRNTSLHASVGALYLGSWDRLALDRQITFSGMLALEHMFGSKSTLLLQATMSESPFTDLAVEDLEGASTQFTLGYKQRIGAQVLFLALTENAANFDLSPDIGLHIGVTSTF